VYRGPVSSTAALGALCCLLSVTAGCSSSDTTETSHDAGSLEDGVFGGTRPVTIHVPTGYDGTKPAPLVLLLHGYGVSGLAQDIIFHISGYAKDHGYFFGAPDGTVDKSNKRFWNATDDCCDYDASGVDDVGYLRGLIHDVEAAYAIDPKRVYLIGHSNGGYMCHRMACDDTVDLAAVVSVAGATFLDQTKCNPSGPINVIELHGDADPEVLYAGTATYPGAVETVTDWATKNGCGTTLDDGPTLDLDSSLAGDETLVQTFPSCPPGGDVELWTVHGGTHIPNWGPAFPGVVFDWFAAHAKP
jgi:polyhydroxybutyrate depolymerase